MAQIGIRTYGPYFETVMNPDGVSSDHPGEQTTSYIGWDAISEKLAELPIKQENGEATRGNELGLLRLNQVRPAFYQLAALLLAVACYLCHITASLVAGVLSRVQG